MPQAATDVPPFGAKTDSHSVKRNVQLANMPSDASLRERHLQRRSDVHYTPIRMLLFFHTRFGARMYRPMVSITKIEIANINWKRQGRLQYANGVVAINGKIKQG
jgi:hypothetical protein